MGQFTEGIMPWGLIWSFGKIKFRILPSAMISLVVEKSVDKTAALTDPPLIARPFRRQLAGEQREVWNGARQ